MKFKDSIEVLRPVNCVMGALTVVIGLLNTRVGVPLDKLLINIFLGVLTYIFIAGAGNIINDIYDYNSGIDIINRPERPLPSERITVKEAVYVWLISLIVGISISAIHSFLFSLGLLPVAIVSLFGFLGWFYAKWGKQSGFFGNIVVSFSFSMGMIYGAIIHNAIIPNYIYYFFLTSFFLLLSREIIKGCEDIEGDKNQGVKTLAIVIGIKKSL
jgi:geranylgeranylglycerol-phosphate geranylgeranyltransferase